MQGTSLDLTNPFALADSALFERELAAAGLREIATRPIPLHSHYASLEAFLQSTGRRVLRVVEELSPQDQQHLFDEVRQALRQFEGPEGFVAPAEMLLAVGTR